MGTYYVSGVILAIGNAAVNKMEENPAFMEHNIRLGNWRRKRL